MWFMYVNNCSKQWRCLDTSIVSVRYWSEFQDQTSEKTKQNSYRPSNLIPNPKCSAHKHGHYYLQQNRYQTWKSCIDQCWHGQHRMCWCNAPTLQLPSTDHSCLHHIGTRTPLFFFSPLLFEELLAGLSKPFCFTSGSKNNVWWM